MNPIQQFLLSLTGLANEGELSRGQAGSPTGGMLGMLLHPNLTPGGGGGFEQGKGNRLTDAPTDRINQAFEVTAGTPQGGPTPEQIQAFAGPQLPNTAPIPGARPDQWAGMREPQPDPMQTASTGGSPQGEATPGEIRRGPDGQTYQYAETQGMAGASGPYGWIPVNAGVSQQSADPYLAWQRGMGSSDDAPMPSQGRRVAGSGGNQAMSGGSGQDRLQGAPSGGSGGGIGGLLGQLFNPGGQGRNRTVQWLTEQGMDPGTATVIASDRDMLRSFIGSRMKGSAPDWQMQTIYDDRGNEQRVLMDMNTGQYQQVGGTKTNLLTPEEMAQKKEIAGAGASKIDINNAKLTEQQSKDVGFYSRGLYALDELGALDNQLTSAGGYFASQGGVLGNYFKDPNYQLAEGAGRDFLAIILRKDTGAAVTPQEFEMYGKLYLPWPGDDKATVEAKRTRRDRALRGIRRGLGTATPLADDIDKQFESERAARQAEQPPAPSNSGVVDYQDYFGAR